jgi:signal peptidase I
MVKVSSKQSKPKESLKENIIGVALALFLAVAMRVFAFDPYHIPSSSMKPTLLIGDYLFVSKFSYGYSKYSLPFSPNLFSGRIFEKAPERGDVVVFRPPLRPNEDWIKRVIGLPGDVIQLREGILYINGEPCPLEPVEDFVDYLELEGDMYDENRVFFKEGKTYKQFIQTLPNGVRHRIIKKEPFGQGLADNTQVYVVPERSLFVMGDNRDGSHDSRFSQSVGFIPFDNLVGKAQILFFSTTARWWEFWKWPFGIRYNRLFHFIH